MLLATVLVSLLAFYPVRQLFVQMVLLHAPLSLRGGKLDTAIANERNVGMGSAVKLPRGVNALGSAGGLMFAPPLR